MKNLTPLYIENYSFLTVDYIQHKVRTGIPGFDTIVSGGLKEGKTIVLSGPPGSGKSTFGMQFLHNGALDFGEPGIYVTLSQSPTELINDFSSYGWDIQKLIDSEKLLIIDARPFKLEEDLLEPDESLYHSEPYPFAHLTHLMIQGIKKLKAKRLVVDSISVLNSQYGNAFYARQGMQRMVHALEELRCTSFLISEIQEHRTPSEWFTSSGIVLLNYVQKEHMMERSIQVVKMRGVKHSDQVYPIKFTSNGYQVLHPRIYNTLQK